MHVIDRFAAEASDGRMVEILKWGSDAETSTDVVAFDDAVYSTLTGRRVTPTTDDQYVISALGITVRRRR
jgi:hypothetical protein